MTGRRWTTSPTDTMCSSPSSSRTTRAPASVASETGEGVGIGEVAVERVEEGAEHGVAVDSATRLGLDRGGHVRQRGRDRGTIEVAAGAHHHGPHGRAPEVGLGQQPRELAVAHDQVVRPLQPGLDARDLRHRVGQGEAGRDRAQTQALGCQHRAQEHRHQERRPRRRLPHPAEATPPRALVGSHGNHTVGRAGPGLVEQVPVGGVEGRKGPDLPRRTGAGDPARPLATSSGRFGHQP